MNNQTQGLLPTPGEYQQQQTQEKRQRQLNLATPQANQQPSQQPTAQAHPPQPQPQGRTPAQSARRHPARESSPDALANAINRAPSMFGAARPGRNDQPEDAPSAQPAHQHKTSIRTFRFANNRENPFTITPDAAKAANLTQLPAEYVASQGTQHLCPPSCQSPKCKIICVPDACPEFFRTGACKYKAKNKGCHHAIHVVQDTNGDLHGHWNATNLDAEHPLRAVHPSGRTFAFVDGVTVSINGEDAKPLTMGILKSLASIQNQRKHDESIAGDDRRDNELLRSLDATETILTNTAVNSTVAESQLLVHQTGMTGSHKNAQAAYLALSPEHRQLVQTRLNEQLQAMEEQKRMVLSRRANRHREATGRRTISPEPHRRTAHDYLGESDDRIASSRRRHE